MPVRALLAVAAALLLGGCGNGNENAATVSTTPAPATSVPSLAGASTDPVIWKADTTEAALLTGVRAARHPGYDRVVFEFRNHLPGYDMGYVESPVQADGSGADVDVAGSAVLRLRMDPALDADPTKGPAPRTYTGPTRFSPDTAMVTELVRIGGFEATLSWAIGVNGKQPFRVLRLESPARLVIDIETGSAP